MAFSGELNIFGFALAIPYLRHVETAENDVLRGRYNRIDPVAGFRRFFEESMSSCASRLASSVSGTWMAIWSPSKSALNAGQTSGWTWMALPSISFGLEGLDAKTVQRRSAVQQDVRVLRDVFEDIPHFGAAGFDKAGCGLGRCGRILP